MYGLPNDHGFEEHPALLNIINKTSDAITHGRTSIRFPYEH